MVLYHCIRRLGAHAVASVTSSSNEVMSGGAEPHGRVSLDVVEMGLWKEDDLAPPDCSQYQLSLRKSRSQMDYSVR